jgi:hypothetical protein
MDTEGRNQLTQRELEALRAKIARGLEPNCGDGIVGNEAVQTSRQIVKLDATKKSEPRP